MGGDEEIVAIGEDEGCIIVKIKLLSVLLHEIRTDVAQFFFAVDDDGIMMFQMAIIFH